MILYAQAGYQNRFLKIWTVKMSMTFFLCFWRSICIISIKKFSKNFQVILYQILVRYILILQEEVFYELTPRPNKDGYLRVALKKRWSKNEKQGQHVIKEKGKTISKISTLIGCRKLSLGPKPIQKSQVDHINNQRDCNHINNFQVYIKF